MFLVATVLCLTFNYHFYLRSEVGRPAATVLTSVELSDLGNVSVLLTPSQAISNHNDTM